jgi:hypothetical protein
MLPILPRSAGATMRRGRAHGADEEVRPDARGRFQRSINEMENLRVAFTIALLHMGYRY